MDSKIATKYNSKRAAITIDASKPENKTIRPVWNATDLSYCANLGAPVVRTVLSKMRKHGVSNLRTREFLQGSYILNKIDDKGNPVYDWKNFGLKD